MNASAFRYLYDYHFAENRKIWDRFIAPLSAEKFLQPNEYAMGSVRNQLVHIMNVDDVWFAGLRGEDDFSPYEPPDEDDREAIRMHWDQVEQSMRSYLARMTDEMLLQKPFDEGEDKNLILWQVLLQVINHGTDHRAQSLRLLHDLGVATSAQDFIFYVYERGEQ